VADALALITMPEQHLLGLLTRRVNAGFSGPAWEATVYLGLVNLYLIALLWAAGQSADRSKLVYVLCGMLAFYILAAGDTLHAAGRPGPPLPDLLLERLPFFRNVRTPSRAIVFVYLFLAIGVGQAIALLQTFKRPLPGLAAGLASILVVVDFLPVRAMPMTSLASSPASEIIRRDPERGFGVLDLPSGKPAGYLQGNAYMAEQLNHWRPIVQGTTARDMSTSLRDRLETGDIMRQRRQLTQAHVKYIIVHHTLPWLATDGSETDYGKVYTVIYNGPDVSILRVY